MSFNGDHFNYCRRNEITNHFKLTQIAEIQAGAAYPLSGVADHEFSETQSVFLTALDETTRNA